MKSVWLILVGVLITYHCLISSASAAENTAAEKDSAAPTFSQCKPYVDAALKGEEPASPAAAEDAPQGESSPSDDAGGDESNEDGANAESITNDNADSKEGDVDDNSSEEEGTTTGASKDAGTDDDDSKEATSDATNEDDSKEEAKTEEAAADDNDSKENTGEDTQEDDSKEGSDKDTKEAESEENAAPAQDTDSKEEADDNDSKEAENNTEDDSSEEAQPEVAAGKDSGADGDSGEDSKEENKSNDTNRDNVADDANKSESDESKEEQEAQEAPAKAEDAATTESAPGVESKENDTDSKEEIKDEEKKEAEDSKEDESKEDSAPENSDEDDSEEDSFTPRSREHLEKILGLEDSETAKGLEALLDKATQTTLKELKTVYETAIKPLETLYKYRDLSNRHFGDPEIFSKPMIVFMGPWSGGKSTILNWLLGTEDHDAALRTGADPSPAQFNIMTHGSEDEVLDGTQLAADWTFSGLQKFGQAFLDRLRGRKLPNRLLEKVNLVEIPGILEVRKQVERSFPFNDACQWFIDRADVLFLVYDPAKLDIGPETEAILDQLKGRENQVRIVLNKADTVKPDELLRLQANLIWNISPLMASAEPPTLYVASLWGRPLNPDSPTSLLLAHENSFLKDIRDATEKRVETRIAAARRFAVRVRNHGKMCDCYLNTYNNHRSFFSNKKKISDDIIENPQNYHIYEGLSTLRNISRYDLPDPETYKDFFRLNPLWEFPTLASTCTYFKGCPINKLDIAIAYDLPELLGKYRRQRESILSAQAQQSGKKK